MKITIRINEFKRVLEEARRVVSAKSGIYVLTHVKVEVFSGNQATMSGTDLGSFIVQRFEIVDGDAGSFLLPAKKTHDYLKRHTSGTATIETSTDGKYITVEAGSSKMKFESPSVLHFTRLETVPQFTHTISLKFLRKLIARVERASQSKGNRWSCVNLESDGTTLRAVATDGFQLAVAEAGGNWGTFTALLPNSFLPVLKRRGGTMVQFAESDDSYFFQTDSVLLKCRKTQIRFPNYQKSIYGPEFKDAVKLASAELKAAIKSLLVTTAKQEPKLAFDICGENLQLSTQDCDCAGACCLKVETASESPISVELKASYVLDFLAAVEGDVIVQFTNDRGMVKLSDGGVYQHFVVPIRAQQPTAAKSSP